MKIFSIHYPQGMEGAIMPRLVFLLLLIPSLASAEFIKVPIARCPAGSRLTISGLDRREAAAFLAKNCSPHSMASKSTEPGDFIPIIPAEIDSWNALIKTDANGIPTTADAIVRVPDRIDVGKIALPNGSARLSRAEAVAEIQSRDSKASINQMEATK